jgi:hypothetical protein
MIQSTTTATITRIQLETCMPAIDVVRLNQFMAFLPWAASVLACFDDSLRAEINCICLNAANRGAPSVLFLRSCGEGL